MKETNFEDTMKQLEKIATELENGDLSLEESVAKFEEGMKLSKECNDIIEKAEKKITILLEKNGKYAQMWRAQNEKNDCTETSE